LSKIRLDEAVCAKRAGVDAINTRRPMVRGRCWVRFVYYWPIARAVAVATLLALSTTSAIAIPPDVPRVTRAV
jgi:hypothetical protein